ncbi:DUF4747 family protein [Burkholderia gladioli]|uniref:DUF4747 family protein n=1 Tax=Burkholderia gladioli TaxID=28095 RepID=UPI00264DD0F2|nr:DUF4747 family protein [Burkholderia gladioli]MDN7752697.1 DUF4747 family protein [Burkholderia gladioli]
MPEPHSPERYVDLLKKAYRTRRVIKIRGQFAGILGTFGDDVGDGFYYGELFKFYDLKLTGKWLNVLQQAPAEEDDLAELNVPEHLKPGLEAFPFLFHAQSHRLFFVSQDSQEHLGPKDAGKYFRQLLNQPKLTDQFKEITVTVIPGEDTLEKIFALPELRKLQIVITPPNPDDWEDVEQDVKERMAEQNAATMVTVLVANKGESLEPNEHTRSLSEVAQANGYVEGRGMTEIGKVQTLSTKSHPMLAPAFYDQNVETVVTALRNVATAYLARIRRLRRPA